MNNLPFVLWMIGWPLVVDLGHYLRHQLRPAEPFLDQVAVFEIAVGVFVAVTLYRKDRRE